MNFYSYAWRPALFIAAALLLSWWTGETLLILVLVLSAYLIVHLVYIYKLLRWVRDNSSEQPPEGSGIWAGVFDALYTWQQENRRRKRALGGIVRQFQQSAGAMPDGVVLMDANWNVIWFNSAAGRFLGLKRGIDTGYRITNMVRNPDFFDYLSKADFSEPLAMLSPVNNDNKLSAQVIPYSETERLLLVRDVTQTHQLFQMRRDFVANASHELKTPLTVLSGYLEAIDGTDLDDGLQPMVTAMRSQAKRMEDIIRDLLVLLRLESDSRPFEDERLNIESLLRPICAEAEALAAVEERPPLRIRLEVDPNLSVQGSEQLFESVARNLLLNAVNYSPYGGVITVRWATDRHQRAVLYVIDEGIGVSVEHLSRLTERFYRVNNSEYRLNKGTGLGLAIVKHALQRMDGFLEIDSEVGTGTECRAIFSKQRSLFMKDTATPEQALSEAC